jgi:hypothetical protein
MGLKKAIRLRAVMVSAEEPVWWGSPGGGTGCHGLERKGDAE